MATTHINGIKMTEIEENAVLELKEKLRKEFSEKETEDTFLLYRLLKVNDFNVNLAENLYHERLKWRKRLKADSILEDFKPDEMLEKYFENIKFGSSKHGASIYYVPASNIDQKGITKSTKYIDFEKFVVWLLEKEEKELERQRQCPGGAYAGFVIITNFENFTFAQATDKTFIEYALKAARLFQNYYPDRLEAIYVINASTYFAIVLSLFKTFMAKHFVQKIHILDSNWKDELLKVVDADVLPSFLGGNKTDPDGNEACKTFVMHGGKIDERHYLQAKRKSLINFPNTKKIILERASFSEIEIHVPVSGSAIEWEFETKIRDIGFGLFFREMDGETERMIPIVPLDRINTEDYTETGLYKCEEAGSYIMLFDNSYSWVRSKEIYYRTNVISPKEFEATM